jgi:hypothetical protein
VKVAATVKFPGCARHGEPAWTKESQPVKACVEPIDKAYARRRAEAAKAANAEEKKAQLERDFEAELAKKCGAAEAKVAKAFEPLVPQIAEELSARPAVDPVERARALQARLGVTPAPAAK